MNSFINIIDKTCAINNCNLQVIFFVISSPFLLILVTFFSIGTVEGFFSLFFPKQVNNFSNSSPNLFVIKLRSQLDPLQKPIGIFLGTLYF